MMYHGMIQREYFFLILGSYQPRIKSMLQDSIGGVLDSSAFASVKGSSLAASDSNVTKTAPVSLRHRSTATTATNSSSTASTPTGTGSLSRSVILFVIGGVTYSEIRAAYEVAESSKREVYIGKGVEEKGSIYLFHRWYSYYHSKIIFIRFKEYLIQCTSTADTAQ